MGKSLSWYVIPSNIAHDATKSICFNLDCEPEKDELYELLYDKIKPDNDDDPLDNVATLKEYKELKKLENEKVYNFSTTNEWCDKCSLFTNGLNSSQLSVAAHSINHSNQNPIWDSSWGIKKILFGNYSTDFVNCFSSKRMYSEIEKNDVSSAEASICNKGTLKRTIDKEALEETTEILNFLKKYIDKKEYMIIMEGE